MKFYQKILTFSIIAFFSILLAIPFSARAIAQESALEFLQKYSDAKPVSRTETKVKKKRVFTETHSSWFSDDDDDDEENECSDVAKEARAQGFPASVAVKAAITESSCRHSAIGAQNERGKLQIKLATARGLGYSGSISGLNGRAGVHYGVKHLVAGYRLCGSITGALAKHNGGLGASCRATAYTRRVLGRSA